jgi:hypothetical protein
VSVRQMRSSLAGGRFFLFLAGMALLSMTEQAYSQTPAGIAVGDITSRSVSACVGAN